MQTSIFLILGICFSGVAFASAQDDLNRLGKTPSMKSLSAFKKTCSQKDQIDFDGGTSGDLLPLWQKRGNLLQIRALIYAEENCTDGASRERLLSFLGNEILLSHPAKVIQAFAEEKTANLGRFMEAENNDWFGAECEDTKCSEQRKIYFAKKRKAVSKTKKEWKSTQTQLLTSLRSDK